MIKFLDLQKQYADIQTEIDSAILQVVHDGAFISGPATKAFEKNFANYLDADHCIGTGNGTDAIEISLEALQLPENSEVIVPANSFIASSEAVTRSGLKVVFCDCNSENYTISIDSLKSKISNKTSAVIAVHLYGHPCDMDNLLEIASTYDLKIIEDCAQAHGAEYKEKKMGTIGHIGTFSFYPGKNLGAYGDAGAIITNNEELAQKCRMIANHGRLSKYNHEFEGRNSRLDSIQAAILDIKLKYLDIWTEKRIGVANLYLEQLNGLNNCILPKREKWAKAVYHLFVIRSKQRNALQDYLSKNNIQTGIHYPIALPKLKAYHYLNQSQEDFVANKFDQELLSLPIGEHLLPCSVESIIKNVREFFKK